MLRVQKIRAPKGLPKANALERIAAPAVEMFMQVQVNHGNDVRVSEDVSERLTRVLESALAQFGDRITRVEVYLADENASKGGEFDKRCVLEAHIANLTPIVVTHEAASLQLAFEGALVKLKHALRSAIGKRQTH